MIRIISDAISRWLEVEGVVQSKERALFAYAVYSCLFGLLPIGIILALGLCMGMVQEGVVLIIPFMVLRKFSGGFHLKSSGLCLIVTVLMLAISMALVKIITCENKVSVLTLLVFVSVMGLCKFSPVENEARRLSQKERRTFKRVTRVLSIMLFGVYCLLYSLNIPQYMVPLGIGICIVFLLQIPCIIVETLHNYHLKTKTT